MAALLPLRAARITRNTTCTDLGHPDNISCEGCDALRASKLEFPGRKTYRNSKRFSCRRPFDSKWKDHPYEVKRATYKKWLDHLSEIGLVEQAGAVAEESEQNEEHDTSYKDDDVHDTAAAHNANNEIVVMEDPSTPRAVTPVDQATHTEER